MCQCRTDSALVNFASSAGLFGNYGQCSYAAANLGLDVAVVTCLVRSPFFLAGVATASAPLSDGHVLRVPPPRPARHVLRVPPAFALVLSSIA
ncbi:KR domain-containing protein [Parolsenella sp. LCP21S3_E11]|uniref:KR domain-containing protein n=1 Tax=Parolsenella sp. LCP21S3_E11 TaxID=3438797 RepID=UPI003F9CA8B1